MSRCKRDAPCPSRAALSCALLVCAAAGACGPSDLPAFANPPPADDAGVDASDQDHEDASTVDR